MSASSAKIPVCNPDSPLSLRLAPGPLERRYKWGVFAAVALPVVSLSLFAQSRYPSLALADVGSYWVALALAVGLLMILGAGLRRPFNGRMSRARLRVNPRGWWLGAGDEWRPLSLRGDQLVSPWLIRLRAVCLLSGRGMTLWLWADGDNADPHRQLRVLLYRSGSRAMAPQV